jgi:hypothetical protein
MFKKIATFAVAALLTLSTTSAFAAMTQDSELFRVIFSKDAGATTTIISDLGSISSILGKTGTSTLAGTSFSYSTLGATANSSNTFAVYFAKDNAVTTAGQYSVWLAAASAPTSGNRKYAALNSSIIGFANAFSATVGSPVNGTYAQYNTSFGTNGLFANFLGTTAAPVEISLASAATLNLYKFTATSATTFPITTGVNALSGLTLTTLADGSTQVNGPAGSPVPLPAAFYLMGSGLLGLVGMRRRNKVA